MPFDSGCGKEALMHWTRKLAPAQVIATAVVVMAIGGRVAAQAPGTVDRLPQPLPRQETRDRIQEKEETDRRLALPVPVSPPTILRPEVQPIDLDTALRLAGVQNPELNVARQRVLEAVAVRQLAAARFLPSINPGMNYDTHSGNLQQSNGNILSVNRSAVYVGAGSFAVAAGTVNIPGVFLGGNTAVVIFDYLVSRQLVRQREFDNIAVRNQVFLKVTLAFSELLRSEGRRAVALQALEEARAIAKLTADYAVTGQGRYADANRAATDLQRREAYLKQVESELLTSSARLCQLLNLDPSIRLHPTDAYVVPHPLVPDPIPVGELIVLGLLRRPELAAQRASVIQGLLLLDEAKALPFSPTIYLGYSAGGFGGGSNLVRPIFGGFGGRSDFDAMAYWTIQNLGVGNVAMIRARTPTSRSADSSKSRCSTGYVPRWPKPTPRHMRGTRRSRPTNRRSSPACSPSRRTSTRIRYRSRDVLPIELLNSFSLMANARIDYMDAIVDYNRAQFELYVALGQPPANALAHPVPTQGVYPSGVTAANPRVANPPANTPPSGATGR